MTEKEKQKYYCGWIEAKDSKKGRVLIGGLGTLGVGSMWFEMTERHRDYPDFEEAPEVDAPPSGVSFGKIPKEVRKRREDNGRPA